MRQNFTKGSHFWPLAHQNLKRVRIFYENSQKGSHFRIRQCRKTRKGSHFWTRLWQQFQKVRICGYFLERVRIFLHFPAWAQMVRSFRPQAAQSKNVKNRAATFIAFCLHKSITEMHFFGRSCGGAFLVQILVKGFEVLA